MGAWYGEIVPILCWPKIIMKRFRYGEKGFTLLEVLLIILILSILAGIVTANLSTFVTIGRVAAANTEVANVKTGAVGYMAENEVWPATSDLLADYLSAVPDTTYTFNPVNGLITLPLTDAAWPGLTFVPADQKWVRTVAP